MYGLEEMDLELARQHHAEIVREASLDRALSVATTNAEYAAGLGGGIAISIFANGIRGWLRWLSTPRQRAAGVGAE